MLAQATPTQSTNGAFQLGKAAIRQKNLRRPQ
jgi:hypothetical protein